MMPILRADFRAAETYVAPNRPKLGIPIAAYGGLGDTDVSRGQLLAWADETTAGCTVRMFPGDHFFLSTAKDRVAAMLEQDLGQALQAHVRGPGQVRQETNRGDNDRWRNETRTATGT
jgi:medium-chain acyl-[acyl-carrier-protein] hydrolase